MTRNLGKHFLGVAVLPLLAGTGSAHAAVLGAQTCTRGTDVRIVEVVSPGEVGAACDLRYTRDAGTNISIPFNASNSTSYCGQRARDLASSLTSSGFACSNPGAFDKVAAMREAVDLDAILDGGPSAPPVSAPAPDIHASAAPAEAAVGDSSPVLATPMNAAPGTGAAPVPTEIASADTALTVPEPSAPVHAAPYEGPTIADGAPVSLTPQGAPTPVTRARYAVGRVVGASPEDPRPSTLAALEIPRSDDQADDQSDDAQAGDDDRLAPPPPAASADYAAASTGRPALDAVVATVQSQAAAWNDGDLGAFMHVFWQSPEFTLVSGSTVTKGWDETYRRYRESYGESGDLGRVIYSNLEPRMLAEDTASVVGRYAFVRGQSSGQGAMTLVLRRFEGAWRIVQHHMVADAAPATAPTPAQ